MSDNPNPEQNGQTPEPNQPQPESPLMGMFGRWHEGAQSQPKRTFTEEEYRLRDQINPDFNERNIARDLGLKFLHFLESFHRTQLENRGVSEDEIRKHMDNGLFISTGKGNDYYFTLSYMFKQGVLGMDEDRVLDESERFVKLNLSPMETIINTESMPRSTSPIGDVPVFFIGSDGERYQAVNEYNINPHTGEAYKVEGICHSGDDIYYEYEGFDESMLPRVDFQMSESERSRMVAIQKPLKPEDYEHLDTIFNRLQEGDITFEYPVPKALEP